MQSSNVHYRDQEVLSSTSNDDITLAEEAFTNYFLNMIGPTKDRETLRDKIFKQIKELIERALGNSTLMTVIRWKGSSFSDKVWL